MQSLNFKWLIREEYDNLFPFPLTNFPPVTSTNVRISPQNFLTFSFNPFASLVESFKLAPSASPKLLNLN